MIKMSLMPPRGGAAHIVVSGVLSLLVIALALLMVVHTMKPTHAASSFSFTAAGDYGQTSYTTANLKYIAQSGASFHLALGDFSYSPAVSAAQWSSYAKSLLSANFPFEILPGDHDVNQLAAYAANLPNHIAGMSGTYAKEYYFDYPPGAPLARFIMISPSELPGYNYSRGSTHYNWVSSAIDNARGLHIPWVIVGMYRNCFSIGIMRCANNDLINLLVSKKVDLILSAHKHDYQASKQIALNSTGCTALTTSQYNANCVVNSTSSLTKGAGSTIVVAGTGGTTPLLKISPSDPLIRYFRTWEAGNSNPTWGVSQFTVSATQLSMRFVPALGGTFIDSFTIHI